MSNSLLTGRIPPLPDSRQSRTIRQRVERSIDFLLLIEPVWVLIATVLVFSSYLLQIGPGFLPWIGLMLCVLPFLLRWSRHESLKLRTPFDIPIALLITGALVSLIVSPKLSLSLGVFQCILATTICYYSWVNYHQPARILKLALVLSFLFVLGIILCSSIDLPLLPHPRFSHGIALSMLIIACFLTGFTIFREGIAIKIIMGLLCIVLYIGIFLFTEDSISSLLNWVSIDSRMPQWEATITMIQEHPISGVGLGYWATIYHGTEAISSLEPTHIHNSYLELYVNYGILGVLAFILSLVTGFKLAIDIIRAPRNHPWYGFGIGVLLACLATIIVSIVESSPIGVPIPTEDTYYYLISPVPWIMAGFLFSTRRLLYNNS